MKQVRHVLFSGLLLAVHGVDQRKQKRRPRNDIGVRLTTPGAK